MLTMQTSRQLKTEQMINVMLCNPAGMKIQYVVLLLGRVPRSPSQLWGGR